MARTTFATRAGEIVSEVGTSPEGWPEVILDTGEIIDHTSPDPAREPDFEPTEDEWQERSLLEWYDPYGTYRHTQS